MSNTERELGAALRREEQQLDPRLLARIASTRAHALSRGQRPWLQRWLAPAAGAVVVAGVLGVGVLLPQQRGDPAQAGVERVADDPEFYQDLDFYLWLAESDMGDHG